MNKAQLKKLNTILEKLESLQNEVKDEAIREELGNGKNRLIVALRLADK